MEAHAEFLAAAREGDLFRMKQIHDSMSGSCNIQPGHVRTRALVNSADAAGETACHSLAGGGHVACLRWLLALPHTTEQLASAKDAVGATPLHTAAARGHSSCVSALLDAGADAVAADLNGQTAFARAAAGSHAESARLLADGAPPYAFLQLSINGRRGGSLILELFENAAPRACANFIGLCEGFRARSRVAGALYGRDGGLAPTATSYIGYRGTSFHRLLAGQLIQGGRLACGDVSIFGGRFEDESGGVHTRQAERGRLCLANAGPDTNACQFYITLAACPHLEGRHVCFGAVASGESVLQAIDEVARAAGASLSEMPSVPIAITSCGRWPPPPSQAATAREETEEPVASLSEVDAAASTSRAAVAAAVQTAVQAQAQAEASRKRTREEGDESREAGGCGRDGGLTENEGASSASARGARLGQGWDLLAGFADSGGETSDEVDED